jgi:hypothetical protein
MRFAALSRILRATSLCYCFTGYPSAAPSIAALSGYSRRAFCGGRGRMPKPWTSGHGWPVGQARSEREAQGTVAQQRRVRRVSFLLVSFSLDKQRKVTRAKARNRRLQSVRKQDKSWIPACAGMTNSPSPSIPLPPREREDKTALPHHPLAATPQKVCNQKKTAPWIPMQLQGPHIKHQLDRSVEDKFTGGN